MSSAVQTLNKVIENCPQCGASGPKELVSYREEGKEFSLVRFIIAFIFIIPLIIPPFYLKDKKAGLKAYCEGCGASFTPRAL